MYRYEEVFQLMLKRAKVPEDGEEDEGPPLPTDALLLQDLTLTQLADPNFAADAVRFVVLEARTWLRTLCSPMRVIREIQDLVPHLHV